MNTETIAYWASTKTAIVIATALLLVAIVLSVLTPWDERRGAADTPLTNYHACNSEGVACVTVR